MLLYSFIIIAIFNNNNQCLKQKINFFNASKRITTYYFNF